MGNFFTWKCFAQLFCAYSLGLQFFGTMKLVQKLLIKYWCNWLQGLISPTFFLAAFKHPNPKSTKRQSHHQIVFALLWSLCVSSSNTGEIDNYRGQFHQHVNSQPLHLQIPKAQKDSHIISLFLHFVILVCKSCL